MSVEQFIGTLLEPILNPLARYVLKNNTKRQILARDISISSDWLRINAKPPFKPKKQSQRILLLIDGCRHKTKSKGGKSDLFLGDGTVINPDVEIIDEYGKTYQMKGRANLFSIDSDSKILTISEVGFTCESGQLPKDRVFTEVHIRNDQPFECKKVYWYDYNLK